MRIKFYPAIILLLLLCHVYSCNTETSIYEDNNSNFTRNSPSPSSNLLPGKTIVLKDITYKTIGEQELKMDIYLPDKDVDQAPLVVWIHGGAWKSGNKETFTETNNNLLNKLLKKGFAVASINYRLSGEALFPAQIQDCNDAVNYLWDNYESYRINRNLITMMGSSAGGHLASLVATSNNKNVSEFFTKDRQANFKIKALVAFFSPSDLLTIAPDSMGREDDPESQLLGVVPSEDTALADKASPVTYVNKNSPPTILLHGAEDQIIAYTQSLEFHEVLRAADVYSELHLVPGAYHRDPIFDKDKYVDKIIQFLELHILSKEN